jgi:hypothetical protein
METAQALAEEIPGTTLLVLVSWSSMGSARNSPAGPMPKVATAVLAYPAQ